jgi:hypothetical protein
MLRRYVHNLKVVSEYQLQLALHCSCGWARMLTCAREYGWAQLFALLIQEQDARVAYKGKLRAARATLRGLPATFDTGRAHLAVDAKPRALCSKRH